jgi:hypothetical protein
MFNPALRTTSDIGCIFEVCVEALVVFYCMYPFSVITLFRVCHPLSRHCHVVDMRLSWFVDIENGDIVIPQDVGGHVRAG